MRDLYSRLGIDPSASPEEIQQAISATLNASIKEDAREVLLVKSRRRTYDRLNSLLIDIGKLRNGLGLSHADNWHGRVAIEYTQDSGPPESKYNELLQKIKHTDSRSRILDTSNSTKTFVLGLTKPGAVIVAIVAVFMFLGVLLEETDTANTPGGQYSNPSSLEPVFAEPALPLPYSGTIRMNTSLGAVAPLEIRTSKGSNYLVKLQDALTGDNVMDIFIRGGSTVEVSVPLGSYSVKYASGGAWYGYEHYFGPETSYNRADTTFHFQDDGRKINGYTITLYRVARGNLRTSIITPAQF